MKRFRVSFLAVIAVLAIGLTAFTKAEKFEAKKLIPVQNCYTIVPLACEAKTLTDALSCGNVRPADLLKAVDLPSVNPLEVECTAPDNVFCCAQLEISDQQCEDHQQITFTTANGVQVTNYARISAIFCKIQ